MYFLTPEPVTPLFQEFGHTMQCGEAMPLSMFMGKPLKTFATQHGYSECLALVRGAPDIFAPFHFYPSEQLLVMRGMPGFAGSDEPLGGGRDIRTLARKVRFVRLHKPRPRSPTRTPAVCP